MTDRSTFALGRLAPIPGRRALPFAQFVKTVPEHPLTVDDSPAGLTFGMDLNDRIGDCVVAAKDHFEQVVDQLLLGENFPMDEAQVIRDYMTQNPAYPSQDDGMVIQTYLEFLAKRGDILGFARVDVHDPEELRAAVYLGLAIIIGVNLTVAQQRQSTWEYVPGSAEWGGHAVTWSGYQPGRFTCVTWGEELDMTYTFVAAQCDEAWFVITKAHVDHPGFRAGFDLPKFAAAYTEITGRPFPTSLPVPEPTPADADLDALQAGTAKLLGHHLGGAADARRALHAYFTAKGRG